MLKLVGFWAGDQPVAVLLIMRRIRKAITVQGLANPDFPGLAQHSGRGRPVSRTSTSTARAETSVPGNITMALTEPRGAGRPHGERNVQGMGLRTQMANHRQRRRVDVRPVALPPASHLNEARLVDAIETRTRRPPSASPRLGRLVWLRTCTAGETIDLGCLRVGTARILHLPGELFVEYQLAQGMRRPLRCHSRLRRLRAGLHRDGDRLRPGGL